MLSGSIHRKFATRVLCQPERPKGRLDDLERKGPQSLLLERVMRHPLTQDGRNCEGLVRIALLFRGVSQGLPTQPYFMHGKCARVGGGECQRKSALINDLLPKFRAGHKPSQGINFCGLQGVARNQARRF